MSKTLKCTTLIMLIVGFLFITGTTVKAIEYKDLKWHTINTIVEKGQVYDERFVDHIEGLTYVLDEDEDELPNGLTLTNDGRITGTVSGTQEDDEYYIEIIIYDGVNDIGYYSESFTVVDDLDEEEWVDFNNLFMEEATVCEDGDEDDIVYTKDGFLVYNLTLANYISYNPLTKTYNITLTQDFEDSEVGNYVELIFNESEYNKFIKFEMIENTGFLSFSAYLIEIADYYYTYNDTDLYSAYFYAEVDKAYTGGNRHLKIKASNPEDSSQYRFIEFNITDSNKLFVAFETNGGNSIASIEKNIGDTLALPTTPTKEGWTFAGWYTDSNLETPFDASTELTSNIVLYAKWTNDYKFVEGDNQEYTLNKDGEAKFKINANFEFLDKVFVDDKELDGSKYTKEKGSTIITLLKDYINSLSIGKHTLKVAYIDNQTVETTFTIVEAKEEIKEGKDETPKTGTSSFIGLATIITILSVIVITKIKNKD